MSIPAGDIRTVVIPAAAGVGNAIFTMPLVRQLYRGLKQPRITVIAFGRGIAGIFQSMPEVAEVKVSGPGHRGFLRFIRWTRQRRPDLYLVPYPSNRWEYNVLIAVNGAHHTLLHAYPVGKFRTLAFAVEARRLPAIAGIHDVEQNLRLLTALGIRPDYAEAPRFDVTAEHDAEGLKMLWAAGSGVDEPFIAIHPGSGDTGWGLAKRWSPQKFGELCARLERDLPSDQWLGRPARIVVVEGPDEPGLAHAVIEHVNSDRIVALPFKGSLGASAAILERAILYGGSDSAVGHLAAAVGTPTVVLYAPTDPISCRPLGAPTWEVRLRKACAPCFTYPMTTPYPAVRCRRPYCIDEISVDAVVATMQEAIQTNCRVRRDRVANLETHES